MKSVRLNQSMRMRIRNDLIGDRFEVRREKLRKREHRLAMSIYKDVFDESTIRKMNRLPDDWLPKTDYVRVVLAGQHIWLDLPEEKRIPMGKHGMPIAQYDATHPFAKEHKSIEHESEDIKQSERTMMNEINAVIDSVTTDQKLIKVWPEIESTVVEICRSNPVVNLPAIRLDDLNQRLGLNS